ncbi:Leucine-rich repeat-containing protein 59 [Nymphon striatum]|nr:Leucine-rich repeat-containing protein 59 [Nymphon striatum]
MAVKRIKDRIDGNEIDFSLSELTEVPEKDLANYPKATHVDLSRNHLALLSPTFAQLKHIVKLDLSKNSLTELPLNFGQLHKLQQLDLYGNKLAMLPVSFCNLRSLKWLDLKDNPLDKQLATASGDCLDEKQCQASAKNVVAFMQAIQSQLDREKQKRLKEQRGQEMKLKAAEEEEKLRKRLEKKSEKERRKQEHMSRKLEQSENLSSNHSKENAETIDKTWKGILSRSLVYFIYIYNEG